MIFGTTKPLGESKATDTLCDKCYVYSNYLVGSYVEFNIGYLVKANEKDFMSRVINVIFFSFFNYSLIYASSVRSTSSFKYK